jgi:hypothetical protein
VTDASLAAPLGCLDERGETAGLSLAIGTWARTVVPCVAELLRLGMSCCVDDDHVDRRGSAREAVGDDHADVAGR